MNGPDDHTIDVPVQGENRDDIAPMKSDVVVVIPTYNEARNVTAILESVLSLPGEYAVIVVDDGSPDGTAKLVEEVRERFPQRVHLIERNGKGGLGTAYLAGFSRAIELGFQLICQMDADFSHDPADLPTLVDAVRNGADMAIGSRYRDGVRVVNWPLSRLILSYGASVYTRLITGMPIRDVTAGFKCIHRRVLEELDLERIRSNGYSFQVELHYRTWKKGFLIVEVPIVFTERVEGTSKMNRSIVKEAALIVWELRFRQMFGRL